MPPFKGVVTVTSVLAICTMVGCGGSPADKAAREMVEVMKDLEDWIKRSKKAQRKGEDAAPYVKKVAAISACWLTVSGALMKEMNNLSPEELIAFKTKWRKEFNRVGLSAFGAANVPNRKARGKPRRKKRS